MKDDHSKITKPAVDSVEARIVAWVMGEASAFEAAELTRICGEDPQLEKFRQEMLELHQLLELEHGTPSEWSLPKEKRQVIEGLFEESNNSDSPWIRQSWRRSLVGIAACLVATAVVLKYGDDPSREVAEAPVADLEAAPPSVGFGYLNPLGDQSAAVDGSRNRMSKNVAPSAPPISELRKNTIEEFGGKPLEQRTQSRDITAKRESAELDLFSNHATGGRRSGDATVLKDSVDGILNSRSFSDESAVSSPSVDTSNLEKPSLARTEEEIGDIDKVRRNLYLADGNYNLGKFKEAKAAYEDVLRIDPLNAGARRGLEKVAMAKNDYYQAAYDQTRSELLMDVDSSWEAMEAAQKAARSNESQNWKEVANSGEVIAVEEPYSTFSLAVSDVSFQLAKEALERGAVPDSQQIKVEQFYNAVDYGDSAATAEEGVAGTIEQSVDPILPGRNLVRIGVRTAALGRAEQQPLRLTLLLDQSGSMAREDRRDSLVQAMASLVKLLRPEDRVNVIGFSRTASLLAEGVRGNDPELFNILTQTSSGEGTNLEESIALAGELAYRHKVDGAQNRIVLFTDGAANLGDADPGKLAKLVTELRLKEISFDIAGIGADGLNDLLLGEMARNGNGRYYVAGEALGAQLAGAFRPIAEDVKVQVQFNPKRVARYRLIGFDENRLNREDFQNDAVDAAEMSAEESGVALYQVELLSQGEGDIGNVAIRFRDATSEQMVERNWPVSYNPAPASFDRASRSMQLAGLSMLAGEKLKGGPLADAIDFETFSKPIAEVKTYYADSKKVQDMLRLIEMIRD